MGSDDALVRLDLNNPVFQQGLTSLDKAEAWAAIRALRKILQMTWARVYADQGLRWERISSVAAPRGVDALYSLRITRSCRALAYRDGAFMRLLLIDADHDATYGKK